jgi:poly-gamma-glutamate synthesis protein (capsule biosynthesis protein)
VGDLIKVEGLERSRDLLYARVADLIFGQDLCFANLESQLTTQEVRPEVLSDKESPIECCTLEQFEAVKGHRGKNFTVLHTACNHTLDVGLEGVETTLGALEREGIVDVGTNREPSAHGKGRIIHCNGLSIGFASATFSLNGKALPAGSEYLVNVARLCPKKGEPDLSLLKRQIEDCRAQGCDLVIASLHWGYEFEFFPRRSQVDLAHALVEHGADVILGHHPHVVQPVEYYRTRRDPQRIAVIAYSLGSLTWTFSAPHLALSAILNLSFAKGSLQGRPQTYIESARVVPVYRTLAGAGEAAAIQIERLDAGLAAAADEESRQYLAQIGRYAELVFGCSF